MQVITPANGYLACGDTGEGKMPEIEELYENLIDALTKKDLADQMDMIIKAAAVADYKPSETYDDKVKKSPIAY